MGKEPEGCPINSRQQARVGAFSKGLLTDSTPIKISFSLFLAVLRGNTAKKREKQNDCCRKRSASDF
jgi:hypothetical protein